MGDTSAWNSCGCSTIYTDAWGNVINGPGSGADGSQVAASQCAPNYGLLALVGVAALAGIVVANGGKL
jgi:hypothetical protein